MTDKMELYAIACSDKTYRLAHFLGKAIQCELEKKTHENQFHPLFNMSFDFFYAYDGDTEFFLFEHKINGIAILKKYKNINAFLLLKTSFLTECKVSVSKILSDMDIVLTSIRIKDVKDLGIVEQLFSSD